MNEVIDYFMKINDKNFKEMLNELYNIFNQSQILQNKLADEYKNLEDLFLEQQQNMEILRKIIRKSLQLHYLQHSIHLQILPELNIF
jgi:hypothetical protein